MAELSIRDVFHPGHHHQTLKRKHPINTQHFLCSDLEKGFAEDKPHGKSAASQESNLSLVTGKGSFLDTVGQWHSGGQSKWKLGSRSQMCSHSLQCSACTDVTWVLLDSYSLNQTLPLSGRVSRDLTPREVRNAVQDEAFRNIGGWASGKAEGETGWENQVLSEVFVSKVGNTALLASSEQCFAAQRCVRITWDASKL